MDHGFWRTKTLRHGPARSCSPSRCSVRASPSSSPTGAMRSTGSTGGRLPRRGIKASASAGSRASSQARMRSSGRSEFNGSRRCGLARAVTSLSWRQRRHREGENLCVADRRDRQQEQGDEARKDVHEAPFNPFAAADGRLRLRASLGKFSILKLTPAPPSKGFCQWAIFTRAAAPTGLLAFF